MNFYRTLMSFNNKRFIRINNKSILIRINKRKYRIKCNWRYF